MRTRKLYCIKCQARLKKGRTILCTSCLLKELKNGKEKENNPKKEKINKLINLLKENKVI